MKRVFGKFSKRNETFEKWLINNNVTVRAFDESSFCIYLIQGSNRTCKSKEELYWVLFSLAKHFILEFPEHYKAGTAINETCNSIEECIYLINRVETIRVWYF